MLQNRYSSSGGVCPHIGFLLFPGFDIKQLGGPLSAFQLAAEAGGVWLTVMSLDGGDIQSATGETVTTQPVTADGLDTLLVVGGPIGQAIPRLLELADFVSAASAILRRIAGIGTGVFVMAEAGLLNGKRAAIGAQLSAQLARAYPAIRISMKGRRPFINDSGLWTTPGAVSGIEMCLALIEQDWGPEVCRAVASRLPVGLGKSQHILAARRFLDMAEAQERKRAEHARRQVQNGRESFAVIARAAGFKDAEDMRRQFLRFFGHPPQVLRRLARLARKARDQREITWRSMADAIQQARRAGA